MKSIVITGVSTGIGFGAAKEFVTHGYHVFGSVRREADATRLQADLGDNFTPLIFDITDIDAVRSAACQVEKILGDRNLSGLINNAGMATSGTLMHQPLEEIRLQLEVNVVSQIAVTQAFLPLLGARANHNDKQSGRIINISSVLGKLAVPFLGAYVGSKHAFEGISHSLRRELQLYGIDVIIIAPGAVSTAIWDKESAQDVSKYLTTDYAESVTTFQKHFVQQGKKGYPPEVFGKFIRKVFETPKPKTKYAIVPNLLLDWIIPTALPARWLDRIIGKKIGLFQK
ncbi:oxidoreductase [Chroococcidiopsis sp. CCALA 051]|uniref:SDR family oxidoreductase n=1 Tax=Chroococcidiopsis sp. CCALA 051 TaxID=869949 RepID=UPI000D0C9B58|nr:SDR family oxidoreductase [Chroococcidiopsis sp. CCALA 051]PSM50440.1 oxidoreductase [Chroococcidiopsis sp. CCALA 051]